MTRNREQVYEELLVLRAQSGDEDAFAALMSGMIVNWHVSGRILELEKKWKAWVLETYPAR